MFWSAAMTEMYLRKQQVFWEAKICFVSCSNVEVERSRSQTSFAKSLCILLPCPEKTSGGTEVSENEVIFLMQMLLR